MIARRGASAILVVVLLLLFVGCGREKPKSKFELGKEHFQASNYVEAMIRLEIWLKEDPDDLKGHNAETHAMLAVMYHDDETRQALFEKELKTLKDMGKPGMAAVLKLIENPTIASRLGGTITDVLVKGGELSVDSLMEYLTGTNPRLRTYARDVLIKIGEPAVESLIQILDDPDLYNRSRAIEVLSEIGDKRAIEPLEKKLNDPSKLIQVQVAAALHGMGQKNPRKVILEALGDEDVQARRVAAKAVWEIIDDPPLGSILKAMNDADADVRNYAVLAVGKTRSPEAIQPLMKILKEDENNRVKDSAANSLEKIGKPAVEPLINLLEGTKDMELTIMIVQILGNIGDKRAIKPMEKVYNEATNPLLRDLTAKALNKID